MRLLVDTHAFLWFIGGSERLSGHARALIEDPANERLLSVASLWEMALKVQLGKLEVPLPFARLVEEHVTGNAIDLLPIRPAHLDAQHELALYHRDPFDRLLIAQAKVERATVVTRDAAFGAYAVPVAWEE